jgi:hypothetical protein
LCPLRAIFRVVIWMPVDARIKALAAAGIRIAALESAPVSSRDAFRTPSLRHAVSRTVSHQRKELC